MIKFFVGDRWVEIDESIIDWSSYVPSYETDPFSVHLDQEEPQEIVNGYPINASEPEFTYTDGLLTRVDYPSGFYKVLAYNVDGTLNTITYSSGTVKTMVWSSGILQSIGVS